MNSKIRRVMCLSLVISLLLFVGCRTNLESYDSANSEGIEYIYLNTPSAEEKIENNDENSSNNYNMAQSDNSDENSSNNYNMAQSDNSDNSSDAPVSTVKTPKQAFLYKNGKKYSLKDAELNLCIAKRIESWFAGSGAIAQASWSVMPDDIWDIKNNETAIEFLFGDEILLNRIKIFGEATSILLPLTGDYNDLIFYGNNGELYFSGPIRSGANTTLKDIIDFINLDTLEKIPLIRITVPKQAFLYKEGKKYRFTDEMQILNMLKEIEEWFFRQEINKKKPEVTAYEENLAVTDIFNEMNCVSKGAVEFCYGDKEVIMNGKSVFPEKVKGFLIPISDLYAKGYIYTCEDEGFYSKRYYLKNESKGEFDKAVDKAETELVE